MITMKKLKILLFLLPLTIFLSCEEFVDQVDDQDPTQPTDASLALVLTSAEVSYIGYMEGDLARLVSIFTDQMTGVDRQYINYQIYNLTAQDFDTPWSNVYASTLKSLRIAKEKATESGNSITYGIAEIVEAHTIGMTAALWGDVPYTEAVNYDEYPNPVYDTQESIYSSVQTLLDDAIDNLSSGVGDFDGDIFGLDADQWIAVANSLKAKFYLHEGEYSSALTYANSGISSASGDLMAPHGTTYGQDFNIWYSFLVYDRAGYMSAADAYAPLLLDPGFVDDTYYRGNSKTDETARFLWYYLPDLEIYAVGYEPNYFSEYDWGYGDGFFGTETYYPLVTYAENQLIIAECELRENGITAGLEALNDYREYLNSGDWEPSTSTNQLGIYGFTATPQYDAYDASDFVSGGIENADGLDADDALYREIIEEKYVSLLATLEVFNDMRRSGYGEWASSKNWDVLGLVPNTGSEFPARFLIPQVEINSNYNVPTDRGGLFDDLVVFE